MGMCRSFEASEAPTLSQPIVLESNILNLQPLLDGFGFRVMGHGQ